MLGRTYRAWARDRNHTDEQWIVLQAHRIIKGKRYCLVVTAGDEPSARVVEPFPPDHAGRIVFGTDPYSRKVAEILATGRCLLVYEDDRRKACVTVECDARVLPLQESTRFKGMWRAFWPDGPGPDFVNVECTPTAVELWDGTAVVAPEPFGRRQARVVLDASAGLWFSRSGHPGE